jgi:hypothetical protein
MKSVAILILLACTVLACQPRSEYEMVKERELASGKVVEDLFLDLHFGMGRKDFFGTCWEHNKKGILTNGAHQLMVQYKPKMPSGKETNMFFYPKFEDNKLYFMPIEFLYPSWFPGNEDYSNEKLLEDVVDLMEKWYGDGFFEVANKDRSIRAMVKIDGNRLIRVFKKDISTVRVEMLDLRVKDISEMNKENDAA